MAACKHKPLNIDCDRHAMIWNALEYFKHEMAYAFEPDDLALINTLQTELDDGIIEK